VSTGQLAPIYGFTDIDGTRPDCWRYVVEVQDRDLPADDSGTGSRRRLVACRKCNV
jgi:hypothetical protein